MKILLKQIPILIFCFSVVNKVIAQKPDIRFSHLSIEQGFSQSMVLSILKDSYGYMWFGTDDGLYKYDGYKITTFRNDPKNSSSLAANIVNSIFEDSKKRLWIGTDAGGLNLFDRNTNSFIHFLHNDGDPTSLRDNSVKSICEDAKGNIWAGTFYGLDMLENMEGAFKHFSSGDPAINNALSSRINCMLLDSKKKCG